jgi:tetratricopeptide (TPR) repeat protein
LALVRADPGVALQQSARDYLKSAIEKQERGHLDGALADLAKAIELDPKYAPAYHARGIVKKERGDLDGALDDLTKGIELDPRRASAYANRGSVKHAKLDFDGALADYTKAIELDPKSGLTYFMRGSLKAMKRHLDGALADLTKAIELDPKYADAYRSRRLVKDAKGDLGGALADLTKAIELDPKDGLAYYWRGCLRYDERSWTEALADYRQACGIQEDDYGRTRIWLIRARLGERDAATQELAQYLKSRDPGASADWPFPILSFLTDQLSESDLFKGAASKDAKTDRRQKSQVYFCAGTRRLIDGDKQTARRYLEQCIQTAAETSPEYRSALAELKALDR